MKRELAARQNRHLASESCRTYTGANICARLIVAPVRNAMEEAATAMRKIGEP